MRKVLFQLYVDAEQLDYIAKKSEETGRARAAIVRDWIDAQMKEDQEDQKAEEA